jgi:hypothetical protein
MHLFVIDCYFRAKLSLVTKLPASTAKSTRWDCRPLQRWMDGFGFIQMMDDSPLSTNQKDLHLIQLASSKVNHCTTLWLAFLRIK